MNVSTPLSLLLACSLLSACSDKTATPPAAPAPVPVPVATPAATPAEAPAAEAPAAAKSDEMKTPEARARDSKQAAAMMLAIFGKNYRPDSDDALADLRQLVLLSNVYALHPDERIMFCTDDFNFAAFWVGLEPRNFVRTDAGTTFDFTGNHLFPGLSDDQWRDLAG